MNGLREDIKILLLGAAAELTGALAMRALQALGTALRGTPDERALRAAYAQAGAAFLGHLNLPEEETEAKVWLDHHHGLLAEWFKHPAVQDTLADALWGTAQLETVDVDTLRAGWDELWGGPLPWRPGSTFDIAITDLVRAFDNTIGTQLPLSDRVLQARVKALRHTVEAQTGVLEVSLEELRGIRTRLGTLPQALAEALARREIEQRAQAEATALAETRRQVESYHRALIRYCEELPYVSLPGHRGRRPSLSTLYVRRRVKRQPDVPVPPERVDLAPTRMSTEEALRQHRHVVILGEPGAGKTTLLHYLTSRVAEERGALRLA